MVDFRGFINKIIVTPLNKPKKSLQFLLMLSIFITIYSQPVKAFSLLEKTQGLPFFIQVFLAINLFLIFIIIAMAMEIKKQTLSSIWTEIINANIIDALYAMADALILNGLYGLLDLRILFLIAFFHTWGTVFVTIVIYLLIKPILKKSINVFRIKYAPLYLTYLITLYLSFKLIPLIKFPVFSKFWLIYLYLLFIFIVTIYVAYALFYISQSFAKIGFIREPYFLGGVAAVSVIFSLALTLVSVRNMLQMWYYYVLFEFIVCTFTFIYYFRYIIGYPSLLQHKWKAFMPFDLAKVAATTTFAFLVISLFYTVREYPTFALYQSVSYGPLLVFLLVIFVAIIHILGYTRAIADRTHIKYWNYLRFSLSIHMIATFYVFSLIALEWSNLTIRTKALSTLFGLAALVFYILYALDMRVVISDLNIKFSFKKLDLSRYFVSLYSLFFIIFFGISFTYNRTIGLLSEIQLESYPFILFFIAFFLLVFISYLSVTHKGFEEIMKKNVWSELSYLFSFVAFIVVYFIYKSMARVDLFPLHGMFFIGYFFVLIIETYAISTLGVRSKYEKEEEYAITDLLNFAASHFLRSDYLVDMWEKNVDKFVSPKDMRKTRFDVSTRRFNISEVDKETRNTVATAMLFDLYRLSTQDKVAVAANDFSETLKKDIEEALQEEILLLPEELRANFDEDKYYPVLFEKLVNDLTGRIKTFVPSIEHKTLFDKLSRISSMFAGSIYDGSKIQIPEEIRFSREEFINYFKSYLNSLEELFPFEETLLHGPIKSEIKEEILKYGFSVEDLLDLVPTGVEKLDEITEGGLQRKTSTLILCEETRHKKEVLMSFVKQGIKDRDYLIFATSKEPSEIIQDELRKEFPTLKNLTIIDLYQDIHTPERVPNVIEKKNMIVIPTSTVFLRQSIVKTVKRYPKDSHKRVILDVYTDMLKYFHYDELSIIIFQQLDGLRKWNCTTILTLDPSLLTSEQLEEMEKKFENVLQISGRGVEESILIKKLHGGTPKHKIISFH